MHESLFASWSNTNERKHLVEVYVAYRKTKYEIHGYVVGGEIVHSALRRFWSHAVPLAGDDEVFKPSNPGRFSSQPPVPPKKTRLANPSDFKNLRG